MGLTKQCPTCSIWLMPAGLHIPEHTRHASFHIAKTPLCPASGLLWPAEARGRA